MGENAAGRLIEMTTKMMTTDFAKAMMVLGCILIFAAVFLGLCFYSKAKKVRKYRIKPILSALVAALIGLGLIIYGDSIPKQRLIYACADGPISLDVVSTTYDIKEIDGSFITMIRR